MGPTTLRLHSLYMVGANQPERRGDPEHNKMRGLARQAAEELRGAAHFMLDREFFHRVEEIVERYPVVEFSDKMPATMTVLEVDVEGDGETTAFILGPDPDLGDDCVFVTAYSPHRSDFGEEGLAPLGHWRKRSPMVGLSTTVRDRINEKRGRESTLEELSNSPEFAAIHHLLNCLHTAIELICEPRIVRMDRPPRAERRRVQKAVGGFEPTIWVKVEWKIGSTTTARNSEAPACGGKAYHLVRGHWRNYGDRHTASAERRPGFPGWWVWIDSHHSGNPAFGVVGHRYEPKLDERISARTVASVIEAHRTIR